MSNYPNAGMFLELKQIPSENNHHQAVVKTSFVTNNIIIDGLGVAIPQYLNGNTDPQALIDYATNSAMERAMKLCNPKFSLPENVSMRELPHSVNEVIDNVQYVKQRAIHLTPTSKTGTVTGHQLDKIAGIIGKVGDNINQFIGRHYETRQEKLSYDKAQEIIEELSPDSE